MVSGTASGSQLPRAREDIGPQHALIGLALPGALARFLETQDISYSSVNHARASHILLEPPKGSACATYEHQARADSGSQSAVS